MTTLETVVALGVGGAFFGLLVQINQKLGAIVFILRRVHGFDRDD